MTDTPITLADVAVFATVAGAVVSITATGLRLLVDYLSSKFGSPKMTVAEQSANCQFDHRQINALITQQNANIAKMLEQNGEQIKALSDANHAAQLRHQIVLNELERIRDSIAQR